MFLPSRQHLRNFKNGNGSNPDGCMHGLIRSMRDSLKTSGKYRGLEFGVLCFDGMHLKQDVYYNASTNAIVGFAYEQNECVDAIKSEFRNILEMNEGSNKADPELAKHYVVFFFTVMDAKVQVRFPVARYCLFSVEPGFLIDTVLEVHHKLSYILYPICL